MRKKFPALILFFCLSHVLFPAGQKERDFVKGNISEKIGILRNLSDDERVLVAQKGMDFAIENLSVLGHDDELFELASASITSLPADTVQVDGLGEEERRRISEKLMAIFRMFDDRSVRSRALEKISLYSGQNDELTVEFLNDYLSSAYRRNEEAGNVLEGAIVSLGRIGDRDSLSIIYNIWHSGIWPEYKESADEALVALSENSFPDIMRILSLSDIIEFERYFSLLRNSAEKNGDSFCEIAENALLIAINNAESLRAGGPKERETFARFQKEAHDVLTANRWSRAADVIKANVSLAKEAYERGDMSEEDFSMMIRSSVLVPSHELAGILTDMLSECNGKVEKIDRIVVGSAGGEMPAKSVVLALIFALGELGDKTAFDTILYVTYISYSLEVIDEAKKSLAKLRW